MPSDAAQDSDPQTKKDIDEYYLALEKKELLDEIVKASPHLAEFLERGGRIEISREGFGIPKRRVSYTRLGLVTDNPRGLRRLGMDPRLGDGDNALTGNRLALSRYKSVDKFIKMSPDELLKRMARRIDPRSMKR